MATPEEIECEYCGCEHVESNIWRKIKNDDDGTLRLVWCCDECFNADGEECPQNRVIKILITKKN